MPELSDVALKPGERLDDLQRHGLRIIQNGSKFCFGMDAVLLSGFVTVRDGARVADFCTGNGIIALLLSAKTQAKEIVGVEIQPELAEMAQRSVHLNGLMPRVRIELGDVRDMPQRLGRGSFDVITCNPPYMPAGSGIINPESAKAIARHELQGALSELVEAIAASLKSNGRAALVYRPNRLMHLISCLRAHGLEPKRMRMVHPYADREANMVLVEAVKGAGCFLHAEPPLIIYDSAGQYAEEIHTIYGY